MAVLSAYYNQAVCWMLGIKTGLSIHSCLQGIFSLKSGNMRINKFKAALVQRMNDCGCIVRIMTQVRR